jgi:hypothetical protein
MALVVFSLREVGGYPVVSKTTRDKINNDASESKEKEIADAVEFLKQFRKNGGDFNYTEKSFLEIDEDNKVQKVLKNADIEMQSISPSPMHSKV